MSLNFEIVALVLFFIWNGVLTFLFVQFYQYYKRLAGRGVRQDSLITLLDELIKKVENLKKDIDEVSIRCNRIEKSGLFHIQKIGLLRFNPFKDTGGDQSFILALLNGEGTGIVISSLHSRTGTRWYAKKIIQGKGTEYDLSSDEEKAVKQAQDVPIGLGVGKTVKKLVSEHKDFLESRFPKSIKKDI